MKDAFISLFVLLGLAFFFAGTAVLFLAIYFIVINWTAMGPMILLVEAGVFSVISVLLLVSAKKIKQSGKLGLPMTMSELRRDREAIFGAKEHE